MLATGEGGGGWGREAKINAIINQRLFRPTHGWDLKWKWQKELKQFAVVFTNELRANFAICRAPARFLVLKGPIGKECAPSMLVISHCLLCNIHESKMQSEQHFSRRQRALCHRKKGHFLCLLKTSLGVLAPLPPLPRFLRPCVF